MATNPGLGVSIGVLESEPALELIDTNQTKTLPSWSYASCWALNFSFLFFPFKKFVFFLTRQRIGDRGRSAPSHSQPVRIMGPLGNWAHDLPHGLSFCGAHYVVPLSRPSDVQISQALATDHLHDLEWRGVLAGGKSTQGTVMSSWWLEDGCWAWRGIWKKH